MTPRTKVILVFAAAVLVIGSVAAYRASQADSPEATVRIKPALVRCASLEIRPYHLTESFYGRLEANVRVPMAFQISGRLIQLGPNRKPPLQENDRVQTEQVIARVAPKRFEAELSKAEAELDQAKAAMAVNKAGIVDAKARQADSEHQLKRARELGASNVVNKRELEKAEVAQVVAAAALDAAKARYASSVASYTAAESAIELAAVNLEDASLLAPMNAVVADIPVEIGQTVEPGQPVMTLVDMSRIKLVLGVVERKLPVLRVGQSVAIDVLALSAHAEARPEQNPSSGVRQGVVVVVPPAADPSDGLFKVQVELTESDPALRPGMVARANVTVAQKKAVAIPAEAAIRDGEKIHAFFLAYRHPVGLDLGPLGRVRIDVPTTAARRIEFNPVIVDRDHYLVASLPDGCDRLVVEGFTRLRDGQLVQVVEPIHQSVKVRVEKQAQTR